MATRNQIADAFETVLGSVADELRPYSEPDEQADGRIASELYFRQRKRRTQGPSAMMSEIVELELSVPADQSGRKAWSKAVRRIRDYVDYQGSGQHTKAIEAAIESDRTLGGVVDSCLYRNTGDELRKQYHDGIRWTVKIEFEVVHRPAS